MLPRTHNSPQSQYQRKCKPTILPARGQKSLPLNLGAWKPDRQRPNRTG
jgi:hypothetical protein